MWDKIGKAWKILALISVVVIFALTQIGDKLQEIFKKISTDLGGAVTKANGQN
ncbi:Flp family type IVb pilin [Helcococcus ovis]|uniref:Flp family type IVb pilin n=1 Tax=Helcococcus ovis TaxID=72026 RepID=UPI0038B8F884